MRQIVWILLLCLCSGTSVGWTQVLAQAAKKSTSSKKKEHAKPAETAPAETPAPAPAAPPPEPDDPLGRTTPHGCVLGFLRAAEATDYAKAAQYLDGKRSEEQGEELAAQLKTLLDLGLSTNIQDLSRSPQGSTTEGRLRLSRERVGTVKTPQGEFEVLLDQITRPKEPTIWLFSQETLRQVPEAYASVQQKDYAKYFPKWMATHLLSMPIWRWFLTLLNVALFLVAASLVTRLLLWLFRTAFRKKMTPYIEAAVLRLRGPIFGLTLAFVIHLAGEHAITALARHYWDLSAKLVAWFSAAWLLLRLTDIVVSFERTRLLRQARVERVTFIGLLGRFFKVLIVIIVFLLLLRGAGVDVSAVIAGLGIGGIALALAAQSTLSDLFGGLSVVLRGAVRVGDFCQIEGVLGTVEDIGISSLSLRTLDRSVVSIPNSKVAQAKLENFAMRDQFWLHQVFTLRFDTPQKVVKAVLDRFVEVLGSNAELEKGSARARLIGLTGTGPQIEVFAYFQRPGADWAIFLGEQEKIILKMMSIVEAEGTSLAAPVAMVQMGRERMENRQVDSGTTAL
jgi:MscS family membrane protein